MSIAGQLIPVTRMRAAIARRMTESKQQTPHFYVSTEIEMDAVNALIAEENERDSDRPVSTTAACVRACVLALEQHPRLNSVWTPDGLLQADEINLAVAIAVPDGLIAPALLGCRVLDLAETSVALADLVRRARESKLTPAEISEGTFTLSNLGMFDVSSFVAIVTPPQVAILATGRGLPRVVPDGAGTRSASIMTATLSVDHRALDGADAAAFLQTLKSVLERPELLLQQQDQWEEAKA